MNLWLSIIVWFLFLFFFIGVFPVIPFIFGVFVGVLDWIFYPLVYIGASCDLVNSVSVSIFSLVGFYMLVKLVKQFFV